MFSVTWILLYYPEWERKGEAVSYWRLKGNFRWSSVCFIQARGHHRGIPWMWKSPIKYVMVGTVRSTPLNIIIPKFITLQIIFSIFHIPCWFVSKCIHMSYICILYSLFCCCAAPKLCQTFLQPHGLEPIKLTCPWDFPGKNTRVGCHFLLQGIFWTQGSNSHFLCFLHWFFITEPPEKPHSLF